MGQNCGNCSSEGGVLYKISICHTDSVVVYQSVAPSAKANQTPGFSNRFSMILIKDLLTAFPSLRWQYLSSLAIILSTTHPNPNLSKNMMVSLSISLLTSVSKSLLLSKQQYFEPVNGQNNLNSIQFRVGS